MRFFKNTTGLSRYIQESIKETKKTVYSEDLFFEDFIRSKEVLMIKGIPIAEVLEKSPCTIPREELPQTVDNLLKNNFKNYPSLEDRNKACFNQFLRLFLHQGSFLHDSILFITEEMCKKGIVPLSETSQASETSKRKVNISFAYNALYIQETFTIIEYYNSEKKEKVIAKENSFFVQGETLFKINIDPQEKGWHAQCTLVHSSLKCKGPFKTLDTRTIRERLITYLKEFIRFFNCSSKDNPVDINSEIFSGIESKMNHPLCSFLSNDGSSVDDISLLSCIKPK